MAQEAAATLAAPRAPVYPLPSSSLTPRGTTLKQAGLGLSSKNSARSTGSGPYVPYSARYDPAPYVRPAGKFEDGVLPSNMRLMNSQDVVVPIVDPEHQSEMRLRHKHRTEPGERSLHWGLKTSPQPDCSDGYGVRTTSLPGASVAGTLQANQFFGIAEYLNARGEAIYQSSKREPLGKAFSRGYKLPMDPTAKNFPGFGVGAGKPEMVKEILTPRSSINESEASKAMYKKTHGDFDPGEPYSREYDWPKAVTDNPHFRFGADNGLGLKDGVKVALSMDGEADLSFPVTRIANRGAEDYREVVHEQIGKPKKMASHPLNLSPEHAFGIKSGVDDIPASELIRGFYGPDDQSPDSDLGKCTRPGRRNFHSKRRFGVPSIRHDIPTLPEEKRSLANCVNYGDELDARGLICPQGFAFRGISDEDFEVRRPKEELRDVFDCAGYALAEDDFDSTFQLSFEAYGDGEQKASIEAFLHFLMGH